MSLVFVNESIMSIEYHRMNGLFDGRLFGETYMKLVEFIMYCVISAIFWKCSKILNFIKHYKHAILYGNVVDDSFNPNI